MNVLCQRRKRTSEKPHGHVPRAAKYLAMILLICLLWSPAYAVETNAPSRSIHVVYDDSGSMIKTNGEYVDTWCQAKYAMEVFAAMLGERDTMNIYYMSDFLQKTPYRGSSESGPKLVLHGSDGARENVAKIHETISTAKDTPFNAVQKAYDDLTKSVADEKWLVILTDGAFEDGGIAQSKVDEFFAGKHSDISVMFLGMGASAGSIAENRQNNIFYEKAATNQDILHKVTEISTRIFNSNFIGPDSSKTIHPDVPMSEFIIFAQGENVVINGIKGADGQTYKSSTLPVNVQYSEIASTPLSYYDASQYKISRELKGQIATFKDDFPAGDYQLDVAGANTIEVYYKPNVEIAAYLTDGNGNEVTSLSDLRAGDYTITFGFVKSGTSEKVSQSKLLGDVSYSAVVINNGVQHDNEYASGDTIYIEEGSLEINAVARYLQYNSVSTHLAYSIYEDKSLTFNILDSPKYQVTKDGLDATEPIQVKTLFEGNNVTPEQWKNMSLPVVQSDEQEGGAKYGDFIVEKSDTPGIYNIYPSLARGFMSHEIYEDFPFTFTYESKDGEATWSGQTQGKVSVEDTRSWWERFSQLIIKWCIIGAIVLFILGYVPPFKKYLPKKLKKMPAINCVPKSTKVKPMVAKGKYRKKRITTFIPYKAEEGTIKFSPPGLGGVPIMQIKAAGGNRMLMTNAKAFAGKSNIKFNGLSVDTGSTKPMKLSSGAIIEIETPDMKCTCVPNQK